MFSPVVGLRVGAGRRTGVRGGVRWLMRLLAALALTTAAESAPAWAAADDGGQAWPRDAIPGHTLLIVATDDGDLDSPVPIRGTSGVPLTTGPLVSGQGCPRAATIEWGDGTTSAGKITCSGGENGRFSVTGTHTYTAPGDYEIVATAGERRRSLDAEIALGPPINVTAPRILGTPRQGFALTVQPGTWTNSTGSSAEVWLRCDASGADCTTTGATTPAYTPTSADVGARLVVQETASNAAGPGVPARSAPTAAVLPAAPVNEMPPTIPGATQPGQTPTARPGSPVTSTPAGEGAASVPAAGQPAALSPPTIAGSGIVGKSLTERHGTWTGGPVSYRLLWLLCDAAGAYCSGTGVSADRFVPGRADIGDTLRVRETAVSATRATGTAVSAPSAVIEAVGLLAPVNGRAVNLGVVSGVVLVRVPGASQFAPLPPGQQVAMGTDIDTTRGVVALVVRDPNGRVMNADFRAGTFVVTQPRGDRYTVLRLSGGIAGCPVSHRAVAATVARRRPRRASRASGQPRRLLWGSGRGTFQTVGGSASASVQGTIWSTEDYCNGTLVRVRRGVVLVRDFVHHRSVRVRAGHSYFA